jgi:hypothetical protein
VGKESKHSSHVLFDGNAMYAEDPDSNRYFGSEDPRKRDIFHPHRILSAKRFAIPLALNLRGYDKHPLDVDLTNIHNSPDGKPAPKFQARFESEDVIDGLKCVKVALIQINKRIGRPKPRILLWLARERNYLPVRAEDVDYAAGKGLPQSIGTAGDFREIAPGAWFPFSSELTVYSRPILEQELRQVPVSKLTTKVESASLKPAYDVEFFRQQKITLKPAEWNTGPPFDTSSTTPTSDLEFEPIPARTSTLPWVPLMAAIVAANIIAITVLTRRNRAARAE